MANKEHLAILKQGVEAWNKWRKANLEILPSLICLTANHTNLDNVNLDHARLIGAIFDEASLNNAILAYADLTGAYLNKASLNGAVLSFANLMSTHINDAALDIWTRLKHSFRIFLLQFPSCLPDIV